MLSYVMVTNFEGHWDKIPGRTTKYTVSMIKFGKKAATDVTDLNEKLPVIFIKRQESGPVEKAWTGSVSAFREKPYNATHRIEFTVSIEKEIQCPVEFINLSEGWYLKEVNASVFAQGTTIEKLSSVYTPPFLDSFPSVGWEEFEDNTYRLLRLIGINTIYPYPKKKQRGLPDGLFKIGNTVVLYDCTLETNYMETKGSQIENYCARLKGDKISVGIQNYGIKGYGKYVWIVTRNSISMVITKEDDIVIKEIPIQKLIEIYNKRLDDSEIDEKELEKKLQEL